MATAQVAWDLQQLSGGRFQLGLGSQVKGGLYGEYPSLEADKLLEGDLHFNNDFRGLYTTIAEDWFGLDGKAIVGGSFEKMDFIKK